MEQNNHNNQIISPKQDAVEPQIRLKGKRKWLKVLARILTIIILVILLFFSLPYVLSLIWGQDAPPPADKDLLLSVANIPKQENSYFDLVKLSRIILPDGAEKEALIKIKMPKGMSDLKYLESYDWETSQIEKLLNENQAAMEVFSQAAAKPQFQYDPTADPANIDFISNMPVINFNTWRQIARINAVKAIYLMRQGQEEAAFDEAMKIIKVGYDIHQSRNVSTMLYLIGLGIEKTGLEAMQVLISHTSLPPNKLSLYQAEIEKYKSADNTDHLRSEYIIFKKQLRYAKNSTEPMPDLPKWSYFLPNLTKHSYYLKLNKTFNLAAEHYRRQIERFKKPCYDIPIIVNNGANQPKTFWQMYFTENSVGKLFSGMWIIFSAGGINGIHNKKCVNDALINSNRIIFAIKKYCLEKGAWPQSLQDLSPTYISKLPADPFSGRPFAMDKDKKIIYSFGANHIDDSGRNDDLVFSYNFAVVQAKVPPATSPVIGNINLDSDHDGLTDAEELKYGTDPHNNDTDGDGHLDGEEILHGYDPLN